MAAQAKPELQQRSKEFDELQQHLEAGVAADAQQELKQRWKETDVAPCV